MHRRPFAGNKQRPLSAIFIGSLDSTSTPPDLPVLPEPPSPSGSSNRSGLPSPPATNSTGSGSVGEDLDTAAEGSLRRRPTSLVHSKLDMLNGTRDRTITRGRTSFDEDEDDLNENEEEHTARLSFDNQRSPKMVPSDNVSAIKRAANLAERNRLVINRLSALSRIGSPIPSKSRSPFTPLNAPSPSASSSSKPRAPSRASQPSSNLHNFSEPHHSGSETEREARNGHGHAYSSSDSMSATPTSTYSEIKATNYVRPRQLSAPDSPARALQAVSRSARQKVRDRSRGSSPGPSRTPQKRVSMVTTPSEYRYREESDNEQEDVTIAALAAIASSRRSPADGSGGKKRPTLPREFRDKDRRSLDGRPDPPSTPRRNRERERRSPSPIRSPRTSLNFLANPTSPRRPGAARYSTVRDLTRKHQTRWMSEDLSALADGDEDANGRGSGSGRKQGHRAGSSDSPLVTGSGRTLLSEGLRAAGLTKRKEGGDDVFVGVGGQPSQAAIPRRTRSTGASSMVGNGEVESPIQGPAPSRVSEGVGPPPRTADPRTPAFPQRADRSVTYSGGVRPGTSMAALHSDTPSLRASASIRTYRSTYAQDRDTGQDDFPRQDRAYSSPFGAVRSTPAPLPSSALSGSSQDAHAEHRRLMMDSLSMFESQLSRLPPMGQTTTSTVPEVFQTSQHLVHMMDKLNIMLKTSTNKALEAQIDHEVSDFAGMTVAEVIATIGMEHRDNLRLSDEVVRTMTAFLLSVGKLLRDSTVVREQQHLRTVSLDEEVTRRATPEIATLSVDRRSSDGRRSRETRRSWDSREPNLAQRMSSLERSSNARGIGSAAMSRTASSSDHSMDGAIEGTPQTIRNVTSTLTSSSRRPYTPRDHRLSSQSVSLSQSQLAALEQDSPAWEPSPTPAARLNASRTEHTRALPPLSIPPSLSTLPSESLLRRSANSSTSASTTSTDKSANRRKVSGNSILTIRAEPSSTPLMPFTKGGNATTAVTTHTVSNSPQDRPAGLQRSESTSSSHTNGVTFSRPSTISVSTLSGLQQQRGEHPSLTRLRTASNTSEADEFGNMRSPMSGSETERPRTVAVRGRVSLDGRGPTPESNGRGSQASTLVQSRRERRRTITEIFS